MLYTWTNTNLKELIHGHWGSICAPEDKVRIAVLKDEIELLKSRIEPTETGNLHTAISVMKHRLEEEVKNFT